MMTTYSQFDTDFTPKNGEKANHTVLSRPSLQLKKEIVALDSQVNAILGIINDWSNTLVYNEGEVLKHTDGKTYISLQDNNIGNSPSNSVDTWWAVQDALTGGIGSTDGGTASNPIGTIKVRSDTSTNWSTNNPILETGEIGFEIDTGNFKIGVGSTAYNLLAVANGTGGGTSEIPSQTGNSGKYLTTNGTSLSWGIVSGGSSATVSSTSSASSFYPMFFSSLDGTLSTANTNSGLYYVPSTGTFSSTQFNATSDKNAKDNIKPIINATSTIKQIAGVEFDWKDSGMHSSGVVAQELEKVLPFLVDTNENNMKSVNYNGIIGYLIECNKELIARIEKLEGR